MDLEARDFAQLVITVFSVLVIDWACSVDFMKTPTTGHPI